MVDLSLAVIQWSSRREMVDIVDPRRGVPNLVDSRCGALDLVNSKDVRDQQGPQMHGGGWYIARGQSWSFHDRVQC